MTCDPIVLSDSKEWSMQGGMLTHQTGGFFSVGGIVVSAPQSTAKAIVQPIIFQPEIGILGFLIQETNESCKWLVQAKPEPGNKGLVQIAPTVQATYSNYMCKHGGSNTHYLSYFTGDQNISAHSDSLQSEQGNRFAEKFNRNSVLSVVDNPSIAGDMFYWASSGDLRQALLTDYCVNTDARSVLTTAPWRLISSRMEPFECGFEDDDFRSLCRASYMHEDGNEEIIEQATSLLATARDGLDLQIEVCALDELPGWNFHEAGIDSLAPDAELNIRYYTVHAPEREKALWDQPLVHSLRVGEVTLICQRRDGVLQVFLALQYEPGLTGGVEFGASYQAEGKIIDTSSMLTFIDRAKPQRVLSVRQSDEGGRFMMSLAQYSVLLLSDTDQIPNENVGIWVTLNQLEKLCRAPKLLTNEARSCVSLLLGLA